MLDFKKMSAARAPNKMLRLALWLTLFVAAFGAYVRVKDAGLACPDWPGCFGQLVGVPDEEAAAKFDANTPLEKEKAWIEVAHRYLAGALGLLILAAFVLDRKSEKPHAAPAIAAALVVAQSLLGMWTVTGQLRPLVVVMHLLGAMSLLAVLAFATARAPRRVWRAEMLPAARVMGIVAVAALLCQIALGGWTSANYAGLACPDFPRCNGAWWPPMRGDGFALWRELGQTASGAPLTHDALVAVHLAHRLGAMVVTAAFIIFAATLWRAGGRGAAGMVMVLLLTQVLIGISAVASQLAAPWAVAHNAAAGMLVIVSFSMLRKLFWDGGVEERNVADAKNAAAGAGA